MIQQARWQPAATRASVPLQKPALPTLARTQDMLSALHVRRLHAQYRLHTPLHTEAFMGNLFRGLLGAWWHRQAPESFTHLMDEGSGGRFWSLCAPWADAAHIPEGAVLDLRLTLIGKALAHETAAVDALTHVADNGLGPRDGRGQRAEAACEGIWIEPLGSDETLPSLLDILLHSAADAGRDGSSHTIDVDLHRPLRFKSDGQIFVGPPSMTQLLRRTLGRVVQLLPDADEQASGAAPLRDADNRSRLFHADEHARWMSAAEAAVCTQHTLKGWEWRRHSRRTGQTIALEGVSGRLRYRTPEPLDAQALLPWLQVADWLQIGTKTTFGFGALRAS